MGCAHLMFDGAAATKQGSQRQCARFAAMLVEVEPALAMRLPNLVGFVRMWAEFGPAWAKRVV